MRIVRRVTPPISSALLLFVLGCGGPAVPIMTAGVPGQLDVRVAGEHSVRVTLRPLTYSADLPFTPALAERDYADPQISLREIGREVRTRVGSLDVSVRPDPLTVTVSNSEGLVLQELVFEADGSMSFRGSSEPILGMGEGGPRPPQGANWRELPVEFDRRGRLHRMQPRWQSNAYGSRNPVALLIGTEGWALFVATPWGQIDLSEADKGVLLPTEPGDPAEMRQTQENQQSELGKGIPPMDEIVPGVFDVFVFDAHDPGALMQDIALVSGPAVLPPKWAMGYMQSHRTLEDDGQVLGIVDNFREKGIPVDAVIYLGTGFTPRGWNTEQPSFEFNPEVFTRDPVEVVADLHERNVKVIVHMVPFDRDELPSLQGTIPAAPGEVRDAAHIEPYWQRHVGLVEAGIDAWWPDEGDWFDLHERIKRHQLYYQGPLSTQPDLRPWSLHRNGHLGIAQWGGWVWSGDTESTWKTLEAQVAVGINHSLSLSPYWGSDIGGFYPTQELTGELYARWFQFGAFTPSFRSHGRSWWTRLPWGWGLGEMGPEEGRFAPPLSELDNPLIEPVAKQYAELRYQLLPYNYTLAWEARTTGMPFMRAMWLHYPDDPVARGLGTQYLWGRDLLIAPVFEQGATSRDVYLPAGDWYDWWTGVREAGGGIVTRAVDLATMPIYVRAGAIIPVDPIRQFTGQVVDEPTTLRVYVGADGQYTLYDDDGISQRYLDGEGVQISMTWDDASRTLTLDAATGTVLPAAGVTREFRVELMPTGTPRIVQYLGQRMAVEF